VSWDQQHTSVNVEVVGTSDAKVKMRETDVRVLYAHEIFTRSFAAGKLVKNGGQGRNRTADAGLFRAALYQLSYLAVAFEEFAV
jgi:hypothetical protein